jgi:hypothetical protein
MALKNCKECGHQISSKAKTCPNCGAKIRRTSLFTWLVFAFVLAIVLSSIYSPPGTDDQRASATSSEPPARQKTPKEAAMEQVSLDFEWGKTAFETVMEANFVIKNDSPYDVKDITIRCVHYAESGTQLDRNTRTIYDIVRAGSSRRFENFNMGFMHSQAVKSACAIRDLELVG